MQVIRRRAGRQEANRMTNSSSSSGPGDHVDDLPPLLGWFPQLGRQDRKNLVSGFESSSRLNPDFMVMMCLASILATLGLLQSSTAVVIGAMLVAPLMSPLVAAGFAVVQGNASLFRGSVVLTFTGLGAGLVLAGLLAALAPDYEPTVEIAARAEVDLLDLCIALASGMVAAYAVGRPGVASTLAGVAIAAALVPPLAVVGITMTHGRPDLSGVAAVLLVTNLVAIILGASIVFRLFGVRAAIQSGNRPRWVRGVMLSLMIALGILLLPLSSQLLSKARLGQARPTTYPLSSKLRGVIEDRLEAEGDMEMIAAGRNAVDPDRGVTIVFACEDTVERAFLDDLTEIVSDHLGPRLPVRVIAVQSAETNDRSGE
jgi:uncharacterized hydrophobic protein (TIGR00271 family)